MKFLHILVFLAAFFLVGCKSNQTAADGPSDVLKQYVAASQKQDIAAMKSLLSKGSLDLIEKSARTQGTTTDEILRKEASVKIQNAPETRNEKIDGDTATVEVKNELNSELDMKMPFVKENGAWRIARDNYIAELLKKASDDVNRKLSDSSLSNSNSAGNK